MRLARLPGLLVVLATLTGCGSLQVSYSEADASTYAVIAPEYKAYVGNDKRLDAKAKERRYRKLRGWKARIDQGTKKDK